MPNPDGTTQVSPPTQSAFGPASASAPPPPAQPGTPTHMGTPGFSGAIIDLMKALVGAFAQRGLVNRPSYIDGQVNQATGAPGVQGLQQPPTGGLGTGASGLGQ
jgi:hypothetical protein